MYLLTTVQLIVFLAAPVHKMGVATGVWRRDSATSCLPAWAFKTWLSSSRPTFNGSWTHFASTSTTETSTSISKCGYAMRDCSSRPSLWTFSLSTRYTHTHTFYLSIYLPIYQCFHIWWCYLALNFGCNGCSKNTVISWYNFKLCY